ncbi:MAG TPA: ABC transporter permease subunit [Gemmatimonadales bacterium]|nr:ABC transporter permease subunit [Gemmatimonadales bacterium]
MTPRPRPAAIVPATLGALLVLFVVGPLLRLLLAAPSGLGAAAADPALRRAIALTVLTALAATGLGLLLGLPLAWLLARRRFRGRGLLLGLLDLPIVVPHPVAGIALLLFLGRRTAVGETLAALGLEVVGRPAGIVAAMLFVSVPFLVGGAREAFEAVDPRLERVARSLGDGPWDAFRHVTLPLAGRGILAASALAWARAVSEFGAIVILTYHPSVASVLIYDRFTTEGLPGAIPAAVLLLAVALAVLVLVHLLRGARPGPADAPR